MIGLQDLKFWLEIINNLILSDRRDKFVPLKFSDEQMDKLIKMNPTISKSQLKAELNKLRFEFLGLPLLDVREDYTESQKKSLDVLYERNQYFKGEEVQDDYPVPFVKKDPKDRESDDLFGASYQEQMDRLGFKHGGPHYNNMGNIEARFDYWAGMTGETYGQDGRFGVFDSPVSGMRASLRDIKTKQNRYKDTDNPLGHAVAEYLGGGREGTLDQKIQRATGQPNTSNYNPDVQGYINDVLFKYNRDGDEGIIDAIAMREAASREAANYYIKNKEAKQKAVELAKHSFPKGTTTKQMLEFLNSLNN